MLDRTSGEITLHDRQLHDRDGELVDDVAEQSFLRGAEVFLLPRDGMPTKEPVAALYRF
jgi:phenylalanine-4-hydroxylase